MSNKSFAKLLATAKQRDAYWVAEAIYSFTEQLHKLMEEKKLSRVELAHLLGVSPAYITKILRGNVNFTIETMVRLARRVGARLQISLLPLDQQAHWTNWNLAKSGRFQPSLLEAADSYREDTVRSAERGELEDEFLAHCG